MSLRGPLPVATFSLTTVLLYLTFVPAEAVHRAIDRLLAPHPSAVT